MHAGGGVWERGVSEFPGSEVRSGTPLYKPISHILGMCHPRPKGRFFAPFWSENEYGFLGNYESHDECKIPNE